MERPDAQQSGDGVPRREFVKQTLGILSLGAAAGPLQARAAERAGTWAQEVCDYLEGLRRADGGYAWPDQDRSHLTPSFAAVGCYHLLHKEPPDKDRLVEFLRTHHPFHLKKLERDLRVFEFQQIQSLLWLGQDVGSFRAQVSGWTKPSSYPAAYERHGYPILQLEAMSLFCRRLLGLPASDVAPEFVEYFGTRRRPNGSFNNTPAADGGDGHVMNTWWSLQALEALGKTPEEPQQTVGWIQRCQASGGGFTWQPEPAFAAVEDVVYTWTAVQALKALGASPTHREACIDHLLSLRNADGSFGARPGWPGNPQATYYALSALAALDALDRLGSLSRSRPLPQSRERLPQDLKVFTIQIEAHGRGSCVEAVELARALRIDLWGAKNPAPGWIERVQGIADRRKVPVTFFVANEEYGTYVDVPGLGTYSHVSDLIAPAGADFGSSLAGPEAVSWEQFRERRLTALEKAGGRLIWQFGENEELTRLYLDDSLQRGGYAAISTFHFGNPDFTNSSPFLKHYGQQIPFIALQDAHGEEPWWWSARLAGFRTLFLATAPTWEGWLTALKRNWVVAVRRDSVSNNEVWTHGGPPEVLTFVRERQRQWPWWRDSPIAPPAVSIVAVRPDDRWEAARPEQGVAIRVRCRWESTTQGQPKTPLAELVRLAVDGREVTPVLFAPPAKWGAFRDHYHHHHIAAPTPGTHRAAATVRLLATKTEASHAIEFTV